MKGRLTAMLATMAIAVTTMAAAPEFDRVPDMAITALKSVRGRKLVDKGMVFVNGHYLEAPYRIARRGNAVFVNDVQVTGQIVAWREFMATQDGYEAPAKPSKEEKKPAAKSEDADLFDDGPSKAEKAAAASAAKAAAEAAAAKFQFVANPKSEALLARVDKVRTAIYRKLKDNYVCFFGSRYTMAPVQPRVAKQLMAVLPEAIRDANSAAELESMLRAKGFVFMGNRQCEDLFDNQADYLKIVKRREQLEAAETLEKMLQENKNR